ncbi:MAG: molybdopterin-dependent oxidoreductase [Desulfarculaceae bacterium]|nr:molybdopterin-dependent oxidoreductase [Desulfarculaceae bacterium]MCF8070809.1 molybdopterin-dependent oxidoreductase [Desulfarculaceae bacterium]MCF8102246.1 molybdopterin-dependent oxidoreductase [Desulfarculaceae bacterium]MCF8117692.1 molybdopterin-dependent oxidoreductase [Desulfarculaceae bacterium]
MNNPSKEVRTHCSYMDHGGCGLLVTVEDGRITKIKPDPEGWLNRGYACPKGLNAHHRLYHPKRLTQPLRRTGPRGSGQWEPVSWDEALDEIAGRLDAIRQRDGARAVAFALGMPKGLDHFAMIRLANTFGSPNLVANQDVCHAPREITGVHTCGFYPVVDFKEPSELVVLWASNPMATHEEGGIGSQLSARLKAGSQLMIIDPHRSEMCEKAKLHLQLRPGSDAALALGLINVIIAEKLYDQDFVAQHTHGFEELAQAAARYTPEEVAAITWLEPEQIRQAARIYASAKPAALAWGNPIEHTNHAFHAARALVCLMALCGNLDVPGGNRAPLDPAIAGLGAFVRADLVPGKRTEMISAHHGVIPRFMTIPPAHLRRAVLAGEPYPVKGMFFFDTNPLLIWADSRLAKQALERLEFLACAELYMTPSAALCDVVLPAAASLEFDDIGHYGLGHGYILARPQVVDPPPECRATSQICCDLGRRLAGEEMWPSDYRALNGMVLEPSGLSWEEFVEAGHLQGPPKYRKYESKGFRTPTGKVELMLSTAGKFGLPPLPAWEGFPEELSGEFPLVLTGRKKLTALHSSYRWVDQLRAHDPEPLMEMHPLDALELGIAEGDQVRITTRQGSIVQKARLSERVLKGTVHAEHGWWFPEDPDHLGGWDRSNFNLLTSAEKLGKQFGTPNLAAIPCRVERAE